MVDVNAGAGRLALNAGLGLAHASLPADERAALESATLRDSFFAAVRAGLVDDVARLLDAGADVAHTNIVGETPLRVACHKNQVAVARLLLDRGADVHEVDRFGSPLISTCSLGHVEVARLLIDRGADLHQVAGNGETALHCASAAGQFEAARLLIGRGADVDRMRHGGGTALTHAVEWERADRLGHAAVARLLLERGADPRRGARMSALALARTRRAAGLAPDGSAADLVYQASLGPWSPATHAERPAAARARARAILRVGYRIASRAGRGAIRDVWLERVMPCVDMSEARAV